MTTTNPAQTSTQFKWTRKNYGTKQFPSYVYDCDSYKKHIDYAIPGYQYNSENCLDMETTLFRVVRNDDGWEVLIWDWCCKKGRMQYIRYKNFWGYKTKKEAIEDANFEIEKRLTREAEFAQRQKARSATCYSRRIKMFQPTEKQESP